jgi:hypothetical protein
VEPLAETARTLSRLAETARTPSRLGRLPGVFFETPRLAPPQGLPRMDVAAFAGFAAAGPLHVPVPVEDPARFRAVFGDLDGAPPALAWDAERGEPRRAHLGPAVEAFFANGGARCWVVRVAGAEAVRHRFRVPGLVAAADRAASPPPPVEARARAAGSWCEELAAATALLRDPLRWRVTEPGAPVPLALAPGAYALDLAASLVALVPGDLLELVFAPGQPALLLFVDRIEPLAGGVRVHSAGLDLASGETGGAFWIQPAAAGGSPASPPPALSEADETTPPAPLAESDGLAFAAAWLGSPPDPQRLPAVRRLSFELLLFRGDGLHARLDGLAFDRRHPRFWAALPTDEALYGRVGREQVAERAARQAMAAAASPDDLVALLGEAFDPLRERFAGLFADAAQPRFPLAGPPPQEAADLYLPWGMGRDRTAAAAVALDRPFTPPAGVTRLERDGLAAFGAGLFLDPALARLYQGSLLGEAEHRHDVLALPLAGIHGLVPLPEVSLVAAPDAVHRGWTRELPPEAEPLAAPELHPLGERDAACRYPVAWTEVEGATVYRLERDGDPAFPRPVVVSTGEQTEARLVLPPACPREVWLRVRAERDGEVGPWSNTRGALLPQEPFAACAGGRPGALVLALQAASPPALVLVWEPEDPAAPAAERFEVEVADDAAFASARPALPAEPDGGATSSPPLAIASPFPLPEARPGVRYYRVRGIAGGLHGPWSNTVRVPGSEREEWVENAASSFDAAALLALHRALLRLAAARADLLALLSLPDHYRAAEALDHAALLTPGGPAAPAAPPLPPGSTDPAAGVPPLTLGESPALGFGALYHPWLVLRRGGGEARTPLLRQPPEGAVGGTLAAFALGPGAWRAPANRPLVGVLALEPPLGRASWVQLAAARVNAVLREPRGFLLLSADTLSLDESLRPISVRRLLTLLRRLALAEGERFVFEPNDAFLGDLVRHRFEEVLGDLYRRGAFAGATPDAGFRVVTGPAVNPPQSVERGRFVAELHVAPARALAFLTVRLVGSGPGRLAVQEVA